MKTSIRILCITLSLLTMLTALIACDSMETVVLPYPDIENKAQTNTQNSETEKETSKDTGRYKPDTDKQTEAQTTEAPPAIVYTKELQYTELSDGTYAVSGRTNDYLTEIIIPPTYNGKAVTAVSNGAFCGMSKLKTIEIPDSIKDFDSDALQNCLLLEYNEYDNALYLGNSDNPYLILVSGIDSENTTTCKLHPDTKRIAARAFDTFRSLISVTMSSKLDYIGHRAFINCYNLESITIPESVKKIGKYAFDNCSDLTEVIFEYPWSWYIHGVHYYNELNDPEVAAEMLSGDVLNCYDWIKY